MQKAYNIQDSQAVSDPSTNWTQRCLTCQIGRDGVHSTWYGRKHLTTDYNPFLFSLQNTPRKRWN